MANQSGRALITRALGTRAFSLVTAFAVSAFLLLGRNFPNGELFDNRLPAAALAQWLFTLLGDAYPARRRALFRGYQRLCRRLAHLRGCDRTSLAFNP